MQFLKSANITFRILSRHLSDFLGSQELKLLRDEKSLLEETNGVMRLECNALVDSNNDLKESMVT